MNLGRVAALLKLELKGPADYPVEGVRDVERLGPEQALEEYRIYFIESAAVLKRHPRAGEAGAVLTVPSLAQGFARALIAPERGARRAFRSRDSRRGGPWPPSTVNRTRNVLSVV